MMFSLLGPSHKVYFLVITFFSLEGLPFSVAMNHAAPENFYESGICKEITHFNALSQNLRS